MFKVGDKVYDIVSSECGEVVDIQDRVKVKIHREGEEFVYYLADGRMWEHEIPRLIFAHQVNDLKIPKPERDKTNKTRTFLVTYTYYIGKSWGFGRAFLNCNSKATKGLVEEWEKYLKDELKCNKVVVLSSQELEE